MLSAGALHTNQIHRLRHAIHTNTRSPSTQTHTKHQTELFIILFFFVFFFSFCTVVFVQLDCLSLLVYRLRPFSAPNCCMTVENVVSIFFFHSLCSFEFCVFFCLFFYFLFLKEIAHRLPLTTTSSSTFTHTQRSICASVCDRFCWGWRQRQPARTLVITVPQKKIKTERAQQHRAAPSTSDSLPRC